MANENIYWSCDVFGSDDSIPHHSPKDYIDPWDLENYAYIREHLDSVEVSSQPSSSEDSFEYPYYQPRSSRSGVFPPPEQSLDSIHSSEPYTGNYAAIEEVTYSAHPVPRKRRQSECHYRSKSSHDKEDSYYMHGRTSVPMPRERIRDRSQSFSCVDYVSYQPEQRYVSPKRESVPERSPMIPIYDDIDSSAYRPNLGMSKYGHLQIDYSCNWNNLDKYICN